MKTNLKVILSLTLVLLFPGFLFSRDYKILQWNIWQEGTMVPGGFEAIVNEIHRLKPDFVTLSEVRNYNGSDFTARLTQELEKKGLKYHTAKSYDTGLLSIYPIERFDTIFPHEGDHGTIYRLHATSENGDRFAVFTAHLDYQNCAYYEPRGYSGVDWSECEIPQSVDEILRKNDLSLRDDAIRNFISAAEKDIEDGRTVIIGGDFNEPSLFDWIPDNKDLYDHNGFVVPWTVSSLLKEHNYTDTYRSIYPDPIENPGFTYPASNPEVGIKKLTWAPKSDERERIDYIFYKSPENIETKVKDATIFGPIETICRSEPVKDPGHDKFITPLGVWPTDHKGLLVVLSVIP
ncbi:MAG: endonuclease/exonuclease/phosphatase family protein [Muribaculaceae bacterium]|nr:endonuclease/exonuclease/phosphatase family protein [Muribaculaceae bacterium]